jgi:hypothetical protein
MNPKDRRVKPAPMILDAVLIEDPDAGELVPSRGGEDGHGPVGEAKALGRDVAGRHPNPKRGVRPQAGAQGLLTCGYCGGPKVLCGGTARCTRASATGHERRWTTAVRALYGGLMLTPTPAALWGGALVRLAQRLATGAPPATLDALAVADPECAISGVEAVNRALAYLTRRHLGCLAELHRALQGAEVPAPWLTSLWHFGMDAALLTPLAPMPSGLFAVVCDTCAEPNIERSDARLEDIVIGVDVYDMAIRCPRCGEIPEHPLPGVKCRELHPVGRCFPGLSAPMACQAHEGQELDAKGLCDTGQRTVDRALLTLATIGRASSRWERALVDAFVRARRYEERAQRSDSAIVRSAVTSPELAPVFAALAEANPGVAGMLKDIGAPDLGPADPKMVARMRDRGGIGSLIEDGIETLRALFEPKPKALPSGSRLRRRKGGGR